jgi:carboxymethylenebutenolidase
MASDDITVDQRTMIEVWERHMAAEFETKDIEAAMATMTPNPFVNHVPVMTGGVGYREVRQFYLAYFIPAQAADTSIVPIARTIGADRGVPPTGRRVEIATVAVVQFEDGKIAGERIYWDQACVLAQVGLIDVAKLPAAGIEASRKVVDPAQEPSNRLIERVN